MPRCADPALARGDAAALLCAGLSLLLASCAGVAPPDDAEKRREADEILAVEAVETRALPGEVSPIEAMLRSPSPAVRARAARAAGRSPYVEDAAPLAPLVRGDADPSVRREAAVACGRIGGKAAADALGEATGDASPGVRSAAIAGLAAIPGAPFDRWPALALEEAEPLVRREAAFAALRRPELIPGELWAQFVQKEKDERVRWAIWFALARSPALRVGIDPASALGDPNFLVSTFALEIPGAPVERAIDIAGDPHRFWVERDAALRALGRALPGPPSAGESSIEQLLLVMVGAPTGPVFPPPLRLRAVSILTRARGDAARRTVSDLLAKGSEAEVRAVLDGFLPGDVEPTRAALDALAAASDGVRAAWIEEGHPVTEDRLRAALSDPSPRVRSAALLRLLLERPRGLDASVLSPLAAGSVPGEWPLRLLALLPAALLGRDGLPILERALEDPVPVVSRSAWLHWKRLQGTEPPHPPRAGDAPPYPFVSPVLTRRARNPRAELTVAGKGMITLELFAAESPHHVASFMELARTGFYAGRRVARVDAALGVVFCDARFEKGPVAGAPLPDETSPSTILRGTLFSLPAAGAPGVSATGVRAPWTAAGSFSIAHLPLPERAGSATVWGRVALGIEVLDRIVEADSIERVEIRDRILEPERG